MKLIRPSFRREDARGSLVEVMAKGTWQVISLGRGNKEAVWGNHFHKKTQVLLFVVRGKMKVVTRRLEPRARLRQVTVSSGQGCLIGKHEAHALWFQKDTIFVMAKSRRWSQTDTYPMVVQERGDV